MYGKELYPTILRKAAAICWVIISRHVFNDGNKRTGMAACFHFLRKNGYESKVSEHSGIRMALRVATGATTQENLVKWLRRHTKRIPSGKVSVTYSPPTWLIEPDEGTATR